MNEKRAIDIMASCWIRACCAAMHAVLMHVPPDAVGRIGATVLMKSVEAST
ncbi:MAG: hypothetical protein VB138_04045 [Burkholderia sp.]